MRNGDDDKFFITEIYIINFYTFSDRLIKLLKYFADSLEIWFDHQNDFVSLDSVLIIETFLLVFNMHILAFDGITWLWRLSIHFNAYFCTKSFQLEQSLNKKNHINWGKYTRQRWQTWYQHSANFYSFHYFFLMCHNTKLILKQLLI